MKNTWLIGWFVVSLLLVAAVDIGPATASSDDKKALTPVSVPGIKEPRAEQEKNATAFFHEIFKLAQEVRKRGRWF